MRRVTEDKVRGEFRCALHDVAHTVVVTQTLDQMEAALDYLEMTGRLSKEDDNVGTESEGEPDDCDWRAVEAD